jgi:hypothetical protein
VSNYKENDEKLIAKMVTDDEQYRNRLLNVYFGQLTEKMSPKKEVIFIDDKSGMLQIRPGTASTSLQQKKRLNMETAKDIQFNMLQKT